MDVVKLKDGSWAIISEPRDFTELIYKFMGSDAADCFHRVIRTLEDKEKFLNELEMELGEIEEKWGEKYG